MEYLSLQQTHSRYVSEETLQASSSRETLRHHQQSETDSEGTKQRQSGNAQQSELEQMELEQRLLEEEIWSPRKPEATDKVPVTEGVFIRNAPMFSPDTKTTIPRQIRRWI